MPAGRGAGRKTVLGARAAGCLPASWDHSSSEPGARLASRPPRRPPKARPHARPARAAGRVALPFELVEDEHAHREESDDHEDCHRPVAATASQPLRICKGSSGGQPGAAAPHPPGLCVWPSGVGGPPQAPTMRTRALAPPSGRRQSRCCAVSLPRGPVSLLGRQKFLSLCEDSPAPAPANRKGHTRDWRGQSHGGDGARGPPEP